MIRKTLVISILTVILAGCSGIAKVGKGDELYPHIVRMDRDGSPRDMTTGKGTHISTFKARQLTTISKSIKENNQLEAVVVHVHGAQILGDVTVDESRQKMRKIKRTESTEDFPVHPIMFTWDASLGDVYADRLVRIRNDKAISAARGYATAPFYILEDIAGVIGTTFSSINTHINHVAETEYPEIDRTREQFEAERIQKTILHRQKNPGARSDFCKKQFFISNSSPNITESSILNLVDVALAVPSVIISPALTALGRSAWKNYERRTKLAIRKDDEFAKDGKSGTEEDDTPTGMFAVMMDRLLSDVEAINNRPGRERQVRVIMIGHSTGTMIISEYIGTLVARKKTCGQRTCRTTPVPDTNSISKIVFVGSASSVDLVNKTIVPFLQMHESTKFFNVTLNAYNERKQSFFGLTTPSLLQWLDLSVAEQTHKLGRVIGKWENMMLAAHTIPCDVRDRFHMKQLEKDKPKGHDEIDDWTISPFDETRWNADYMLN